MKNEVPKINWSVLYHDLSWLAAKMAWDDPECKKEIAPIIEKRQRMLDRFRTEENTILQKYKQKYLDQLCAEKENMEKLIVDFLNQRKEHFDPYIGGQMKETAYLSKEKVKQINDNLEQM